MPAALSMLFCLLMTTFLTTVMTTPALGQEPSPEISLSLGYYSEGKLEKARAFKSDRNNLLLLFPRRERHYANKVLLEMVEQSFRRYRRDNPSTERLQIGEVTAINGGPLSGHNSHQNGLDLDAIYLRSDLTEQEINDSGSFRESFVEEGRVTENFDIARNWELFKIFVATGTVNRIFVDMAIKKEMCAYATIMGEYQTQEEALRVLRPWPRHDDHFHLRLKCPTDSPECVGQTPPPAGPGCDDLEMIDESFAP
jgi:penicillin-insensitive murein endopeptidase